MACGGYRAEMKTEWQCADETRSIRANALPIKVDVVDVVDGGARAALEAALGGGGDGGQASLTAEATDVASSSMIEPRSRRS